MNTEPMSAGEVLATIKGAAARTPHRDDTLALYDAHAAIIAMAEREAALVARHAATERDACLQAERANALESRLAALIAENEALLADAERYQELRSRMIAADFEWGDPATAVLVFRYEFPVSANLDAMIDAARAEARHG